MVSGAKEPPRELPRPVDVRDALREALDRVGSTEPMALIGGVALAFHGIERYTKDVDLAVTVPTSSRVSSELADWDPRVLSIGGVSIATPSGTRVDLIDRRVEFRALYEETIEDARKRGGKAIVGGHELPVASLAYLVALKMAADRPKDEVDLTSILARPELDYPEAREIVVRHVGYFAARRLDRLARQAGRDDAPLDYENGTMGR
ncbi:MAG: nucleotidyl transferase AbiEii/AbiGii toxin family protein [Deltaproteobacteria bacterium]|nr:nucleotidyl transferase AbiEii/AbiGii toxin family protein [Deltaproteobacteria bacterium]